MVKALYNEDNKNIFKSICTFLCVGFPGGSVVMNLPANAGDMGSIPGSGRSQEQEMVTHSNILALKIPWTEEPDRLLSVHGAEKNQTQPSD